MTVQAIVADRLSENTESREFAEMLADMLAQQGLDVIFLTHFYELPRDHAALKKMQSISAPLLVFTWLKPRAAFWTLQQAGVDGTRAEKLPHAGADRPIVCFDMSDACCPGTLVNKALAVVGEQPGGDGMAEVRRLVTEVKERWYPVIDYDRCSNCLDCLEFCLFGVYDTDDAGRLTVVEPDACKPGCPACSRVCPDQAIMFPTIEGEPGIAGDDHAPIAQFDPARLLAMRDKYAQGEIDPAKLDMDQVRSLTCACLRQREERNSEQRDAKRTEG
jgi:hypothetical protein